jgi:hypothetical protein
MVTGSGYRAYYLLYRPRNGGKPRAYRIGAAEDLSSREAKTRAEAIRGIVVEGKDPVADERRVGGPGGATRRRPAISRAQFSE